MCMKTGTNITITKYHYHTKNDGTKLYEWDYEGRSFRMNQDEKMNIGFRAELIEDGWSPTERSDGYEVWTKIALDKD